MIYCITLTSSIWHPIKFLFSFVMLKRWKTYFSRFHALLPYFVVVGVCAIFWSLSFVFCCHIFILGLNLFCIFVFSFWFRFICNLSKVIGLIMYEFEILKRKKIWYMFDVTDTVIWPFIENKMISYLRCSPGFRTGTSSGNRRKLRLLSSIPHMFPFLILCHPQVSQSCPFLVGSQCRGWPEFSSKSKNDDKLVLHCGRYGIEIV